MLVVGDNYRIIAEKEQWVLRTRREGEDKNGNPKTHWDETYYPKNFTAIANRICDTEMKSAIGEDMKSMKESFESNIEKLIKALEVANGD